HGVARREYAPVAIAVHRLLIGARAKNLGELARRAFGDAGGAFVRSAFALVEPRVPVARRGVALVAARREIDRDRPAPVQQLAGDVAVVRAQRRVGFARRGTTRETHHPVRAVALGLVLAGGPIREARVTAVGARVERQRVGGRAVGPSEIERID